MGKTNLDELVLSTGLATASLADDAVTTAKINDDAVTTAKINDDAVTKAKLAGSFLGKALINGGSAGAHTVSDIASGDELVLVFEQDGTSGLLTDLTSEFSITGANTIDNTGGTDTTGDKLFVLYLDLT